MFLRRVAVVGRKAIHQGLYPKYSPIIAVRCMSVPSNSEPPIGDSLGASTPSSIDFTLQNIEPASQDVLANLAQVATEVAAHPELGWSPKELVMQLIENVHVFADIPYYQSIIVLTIGLRILLMPVALKTVVNGARMAVLRPDMQQVQDAMSADPNKSEPIVQQRYAMEMKGLFLKHKVNPFHAMMMPLFQMPIFISCFMALRAMGDVFPAFATGGASWFVDLSVADPYYIFPAINALTFLAMIEMGADGIQSSQKQTFKFAMRALALAMGPLTMNMPMGLFVYWTTNNSFSIVQTLALKNEKMREVFGIPKPPPVDSSANLKIRNPLQNIYEMVQKEKAQSETARAEIVDGSKPPPPPGPPPTTFSSNPKRKGKQ